MGETLWGLDGDHGDGAPRGEPAEAVGDGDPCEGPVDNVDGRDLDVKSADDVSLRSRGACTDAATNTLASLRAWVAALEVDQDEETVDTFGDTHARGGCSHFGIEVQGGGAGDDAGRRAVDGNTSPHAEEEGAEGYATERHA